MNAVLMEPQPQTKKDYDRDMIVRFEEGLIGFAECKDFVLIETEEIKPFRVLQSVDSSAIAFVVVDPRFRIAEYNSQIPLREWEAIGVTDPANRFAMVIVNVGLNAKEITGNCQAPLLINYEKMTGRQVILTDSGFCLRLPLLA